MVEVPQMEKACGEWLNYDEVGFVDDIRRPFVALQLPIGKQAQIAGFLGEGMTPACGGTVLDQQKEPFFIRLLSDQSLSVSELTTTKARFFEFHSLRCAAYAWAQGSEISGGNSETLLSSSP